jgi:hypothetical protein
MIAGYGAVPPDGMVTVTVNEPVLPPSETLTLISVRETVPVTLDGFGGFVP